MRGCVYAGLVLRMRMSTHVIRTMAYVQALQVVLLFCTLASARYEPNWDSLDARPLPAWYDQSKFGIFIHWGVFSVPSYGGGKGAGEWFWWDWKGAKESWAVDFMEKNYLDTFTYPDFGPQFQAELFDPDEWADLFFNSGAKYVVLTSKHHEGWTNWPSNTSWNWNAKDLGPHVDLVGSLAQAVTAYPALHFGLYFSQFEWFNPTYLSDKAGGFKTQNYVAEVSIPQMHEIVNMYKPYVLWSDGDWEAPDTYWNSTEFLAWLYNDSPVKDYVVVNDRWGSGCACHHGGYYTCSDRYDPHTLQKHKWENAMTIDRYSWGFRREATIDQYLSIEELVSQLVITVSCGGNMLMNVGPTHDGRIAPILQERLEQMGTWLQTNGEAIYNTTPWTHQNDSLTPGVWYTQKIETKSVYAIFLEWPTDYTLRLQSIKPPSTANITLLGSNEPIKWTSGSSEIFVTLPYLPLGTPLQWAWTLKFPDSV